MKTTLEIPAQILRQAKATASAFAMEFPGVHRRGIRTNRTWGLDLILSGARELAIPVIVAGEFAFGVAQSRHREAYERSLAAYAGPMHRA